MIWNRQSAGRETGVGHLGLFAGGSVSRSNGPHPDEFFWGAYPRPLSVAGALADPLPERKSPESDLDYLARRQVGIYAVRYIGRRDVGSRWCATQPVTKLPSRG